MRMPSWPCENEWEGIRKAGGTGSEGYNTREARDTLAGTGHIILCSFSFPEFNWYQEITKEYTDG